MTWYYALGNERQGPVDDAELDRLVAAGTVSNDTLVWKAGMADWQPLAQARPRPRPTIPPPPAPLPAPVAPTPSPVSSSTPAVSDPSRFAAGTTFGTPGFGAGSASPSDAGAPAGGGYGEPSRGASLGAQPTEDPDEAYARIIGTSRSFAIGDVVARAWTAVSGNLLPAVGITALAYLAMVIAGFIPCLGSIINIVVQGPILGGLYIYFLKLLRTNNATFEDALSGFSMFLPLLLYTIVSSLLLVFAMVPSGIIFFVGAWLGEQNEVLGFLVMAVAGIVAFVPLVYLAVSWVFSVPLIVDKRFDFWPAMELSRKVVAKRFFNVFGLLIVSFGIVLAGALALCVGIFVAAPLCLAALAAAYDDLFGHEVKRWA
jgi:hypothetical protein